MAAHFAWCLCISWSNVVALVPAQRSREVAIGWVEVRSIPSLFFVHFLQLRHNEVDQHDGNYADHSRIALRVFFSAHNDGNEEQAYKGDWNGDDPALQSILLSVSSGEDNSLACLRITACEGYIVDDVIDDAWAASDVDQLSHKRVTSDPMSQKIQWFQRNLRRM